MRFWMRLRSSGSVTSVQSTSLETDFDLFTDGEVACFLDDEQALLLLLLALLLELLLLSEPCLAIFAVIAINFSGLSKFAFDEVLLRE